MTPCPLASCRPHPPLARCSGSREPNGIDSWPLDGTTSAPAGIQLTPLSAPFGVFSILPGGKVGVYQALATIRGGAVADADAY